MRTLSRWMHAEVARLQAVSASKFCEQLHVNAMNSIDRAMSFGTPLYQHVSAFVDRS